MNPRDRKKKLREAAERFRRTSAELIETAASRRFSFNRQAALITLNKAPRLFLGCCALIRALKRHPEFLGSESSVMLVIVPSTWLMDDMEHVVEACF